MKDVEPFAIVVAVAALALLAAVGSNRLSERVGIPSPAIFLIAAAVASDLVPALGGVSIEIDQRIVTVALVLILFDGGMHIGWARFRSIAGGIAWLGVTGTLVTAGALALAAHSLFDFSWRTALLLGTALAPTDPAVVFSVLGRREIRGRSGTLLEGESGANDPVGIALMISILGASGGGFGAVAGGAGQFALQMALGAVFGLAGGKALLVIMRRVPLPNEALYPLQTIAVSLLVYGVTTACHGSGFLAVFLAGIVVGDARAPYKREIERFASALGNLGEIVAFVVLGLSVSLRDVFSGGRVATGVGLAALLILVVRPVLVGLVLLPVRLSRGERGFVLWAGLKGAVPILLGTYVLAEGVPGSHRIYDVIFVVVTISVVVQGGLVPVLARVLHVPMRAVEPEPWALGMRFRDEPQGLHRYVVAAASRADGCAIAELPLGENVWISMVSRAGRLVQVRGGTVLQAGDEVLALADESTDVGALFGP
ncbi:MAG: potassium/proton antiporter [Jatrophihabitans sp.]